MELVLSDKAPRYARRQHVVTEGGANCWVQYETPAEDGAIVNVVRDWARPENHDGLTPSPASEPADRLARWKDNVVENRKRVERTIADLADKHKGEPAYIVATGPGIERNWYELKRIERGTIIGINDTARMVSIAPLLDYYVAMDGGPLPPEWRLAGVNKEFTAQPVFDVTVDWEFARHFKSVLWFRHEHEGGCPLPDMPGAVLDNFRTVAATAIHLAYHMGCNPIVLLGQDCAFTEMSLHAWQPIVADDIETLERRNGQICLYPGLHGRAYLTGAALVIFKYLIEAVATMLKFNGVRLINCTETGIVSEGIECESLADVVDEENRCQT